MDSNMDRDKWIGMMEESIKDSLNKVIWMAKDSSKNKKDTIKDYFPKMIRFRDR